jgi:hypothetical protein
MTIAALTASAATARPALAADGEPEPPVTPFIDSGNDLPDLDARAREAARDRAAKAGPLRWYGWQLLTADLAVAACLAGTRSGWCLAAYPISGPFIHLANGRPGMASASISIRVGIPLTTVGMGKDHSECPDTGAPPKTVTSTDGTTVTTTPGNWGGFSDPLCGLELKDLLIGAAIAALVDAAFSFRRGEPKPSSEAGARQPYRIEPQLSIGREGVSLGLGAAF